MIIMEDHHHNSRKRKRQQQECRTDLTAGIGMKMLKNMGYKGGGLGKNEQGIINFMDPKLRPKKLGMGFNNRQESQSMIPNLQPVIEEVEEEPTNHDVPPIPTWKKNVINNNDNSNTKKDLSLAEFLAQKMDEKSDVEDKDDDDASIPSSDNDVTTMLAKLEDQKAIGELTLESLAEEIRRIYAGQDDCNLNKLSQIVFRFAKPLFNEMFRGWDPLRNPRHGFDIVSTWKGLLHGKGEREEQYYDTLVSEVVLSELRMVGLNSWEADDPEPMLEFLESWEELLPRSELRDILYRVVLPKLKFAIYSWQPNPERVSFHLWVHPWLPLLLELGDEYQLELEELFETVKLKLCDILSSWHPSDGSGYAIVSPWKVVFGSTTWELLMRRYVVPKLELVLKQDVEVNPANQKLEQFNCVMRWASAIPMHLMVDMLVKGFFPNWIKGLQLWLKTNPNFEDVANWFKGWEELIPEGFHTNGSIRRQVECAVNMMYLAVEERVVEQKQQEAVSADQANSCAPTEIDGVDHEMNLKRSNVLDEVEFEAKRRAAAFSANCKLERYTDDSYQMTLKDVIEAVAQEHGVLFRPKPGRMYDGHQVYSFGNVSIRIDFLAEKIYAQTEENWSLVTFEMLLDLHKNKERRS